MSGAESLSRQYEKAFDPLEYLRAFYASIGGTLQEKDILTWYADRFHEIFKTGNVKGSRLLDVGTGPNIYTLISASVHADSIVLAEFLPQNRRALKQWLDGDLGFSFSHFFKYITDKEGQGQAPEEREAQVKRKVNAIIPIDLLKDEPFSPCFLPQFPVITSSLCLEAVSKEYTEYKKIAKRVASFLQPGGHFVLCGVLNQTFYLFGGEKFENCHTSAQQVKDAWTEAGLNILVWQEGDAQGGDDCDFNGIFVMLAQK